MKPLNIGSRRELFVDDYLIENLQGGARQVLHHPEAREIVLEHDRAWEGNTCGYHTFFRDGDIVRAYYRGSHHGKIHRDDAAPQVTCMAESDDGIAWRKPALGLFEHNGSTVNNIILTGLGHHNFAPFRDTNPDCALEQQYKALGGKKADGGLFAFASPDGVHWKSTFDEPVITDGAFDSQNLAFWDHQIGQYRAYYRDFTKDKVRDIKTATSPDFDNWTTGEWLQYPGAPTEQLYTNQILQYDRAPHLYLGFPTRYLPDRGQITEGLFMSSRDGHSFKRWGEALIRPGANRDRWGNRCNYIWHGLIETPSPFPGAPNELSLYSTEHYYEGSSNRVRRFALRLDGFVSINAPLSGGELLTKPFLFDGNQLTINASTSAAGWIRVEVQDETGKPLPGYSLDDCNEFWGDEIEGSVTWKEKPILDIAEDKLIRLRFVMSDADIYALRFLPGTSS